MQRGGNGRARGAPSLVWRPLHCSCKQQRHHAHRILPVANPPRPVSFTLRAKLSCAKHASVFAITTPRRDLVETPPHLELQPSNASTPIQPSPQKIAQFTTPPPPPPTEHHLTSHTGTTTNAISCRTSASWPSHQRTSVALYTGPNNAMAFRWCALRIRRTARARALDNVQRPRRALVAVAHQRRNRALVRARLERRQPVHRVLPPAAAGEKARRTRRRRPRAVERARAAAAARRRRLFRPVPVHLARRRHDRRHGRRAAVARRVVVAPRARKLGLFADARIVPRNRRVLPASLVAAIVESQCVEAQRGIPRAISCVPRPRARRRSVKVAQRRRWTLVRLVGARRRRRRRARARRRRRRDVGRQLERRRRGRRAPVLLAHRSRASAVLDVGDDSSAPSPIDDARLRTITGSLLAPLSRSGLTGRGGRTPLAGDAGALSLDDAPASALAACAAAEATSTCGAAPNTPSRWRTSTCSSASEIESVGASTSVRLLSGILVCATTSVCASSPRWCVSSRSRYQLCTGSFCTSGVSSLATCSTGICAARASLALPAAALCTSAAGADESMPANRRATAASICAVCAGGMSVSGSSRR